MPKSEPGYEIVPFPPLQHQMLDWLALCLTVSLDHDVVDGAPAARFTRRLSTLIETGAGLIEGVDKAACGVQYSATKKR